MIKKKPEKRVIEQIKDPIDSSMMVGAWRAVEGIDDIFPFFVSPMGCSFHLGLVWSRHKGYMPSMARAAIRDEDVIMGFDSKLELSLNKAIDSLPKIKPQTKAIAAISSDAAEIVLPDIDGIAKKIMEERGDKIKIIPIHAAGLKGHHVDGYNLATLKFLENYFERAKSIIPKSVNLLGVVDDEITHSGDVAEVKRLLNAIGISTISPLFLRSTTEDIKNAGKAEANIVLYEEYGLQAAKYLEKEFGMPYICESPPFGFEGTREWLLKVGDYFGLKEEASNFIGSEEKRVFPLIVQADQCLNRRTMAIYADPTIATGITRLVTEMNMLPVIVGFSVESELSASFLDEILKRYDIAPEVLFEDNINFQFMTRELKPEVFFGCGYHLELAYEVGAFFVVISFPQNTHLRIFDVPAMGYEGLLYMVQKLGNEMISHEYFDETVYGKTLLDRL